MTSIGNWSLLGASISVTLRTLPISMPSMSTGAPAASPRCA